MREELFRVARSCYALEPDGDLDARDVEAFCADCAAEMRVAGAVLPARDVLGGDTPALRLGSRERLGTVDGDLEECVRASGWECEACAARAVADGWEPKAVARTLVALAQRLPDETWVNLGDPDYLDGGGTQALWCGNGYELVELLPPGEAGGFRISRVFVGSGELFDGGDRRRLSRRAAEVGGAVRAGRRNTVSRATVERVLSRWVGHWGAGDSEFFPLSDHGLTVRAYLDPSSRAERNARFRVLEEVEDRLLEYGIETDG